MGMWQCPQYKDRVSLEEAGMDEHVGIGRSGENSLLLKLQFAHVDTVVYPALHCEVRHPLVPQPQSKTTLQKASSRQSSVQQQIGLQRHSFPQQPALIEVGEQFEAFIRLQATCLLFGEWLLDMEGSRVKGEFLWLLGLFLHGSAEGLPVNLHLLSFPLPLSLQESLLYVFILLPFRRVRVSAMTLPSSLPFLQALLKLQIPMALLIHEMRLLTLLLLQLTVLGPHLIPKPNDSGVQGYGISLVATGQVVLLFGWDDESKPLILVDLGDTFGYATVGQVYHLLRLALRVTPDAHQQLLMRTLNQRNNHCPPGCEEQGRSLEENLVRGVQDQSLGKLVLTSREGALGRVRFIMHNYYSWIDGHATGNQRDAEKGQTNRADESEWVLMWDGISLWAGYGGRKRETGGEGNILIYFL